MKILIICLFIASCAPVKTGPVIPGKNVGALNIGHIKMCLNKETRVEALCPKNK